MNDRVIDVMEKLGSTLSSTGAVAFAELQRRVFVTGIVELVVWSIFFILMLVSLILGWKKPKADEHGNLKMGGVCLIVAGCIGVILLITVGEIVENLLATKGVVVEGLIMHLTK